MPAFLLSITLLLAGAALSAAALLTDAPITALGPTCNSLGLLVIVIAVSRRKDDQS